MEIVSFRPREPQTNETAERILVTFLDKVRSGEVKDIAVCSVNGDGSVSSAISCDVDVFAMLGSIENMKMRHYNVNVEPYIP